MVGAIQRARAAVRLLLFFAFVLLLVPLAWVLGFVSDVLARVDTASDLYLSVLVARLRAFLMSFGCRGAALICDVRIHVTGSLPAAQPSLLLANHLSYLDVVAIGAHFRCGFVAKKEIAAWPIIGTVAKGLGCIFLDRGDLGSRVRALHGLGRRLRAATMCVFPEGTTTSRRSPCPSLWQTGQTWAALKSGRSVVAVAVTYHALERAAWVDQAAFLPHLFELLKQGSIDAHLALATLPVPTERFHPRFARQVSRAARSVVADLCLRLPAEGDSLQARSQFDLANPLVAQSEGL